MSFDYYGVFAQSAPTHIYGKSCPSSSLSLSVCLKVSSRKEVEGLLWK